MKVGLFFFLECVSFSQCNPHLFFYIWYAVCVCVCVCVLEWFRISLIVVFSLCMCECVSWDFLMYIYIYIYIKHPMHAYNVARLNDPSYRERFQQVLDEKLQDCVTTEGSTEKWTSFKETVSKTAKEVLGVKNGTHEDWFDENDEKIKEAIHAMSYIEWLNDPSSVSKRKKFKGLQAKVQTDFRALQD